MVRQKWLPPDQDFLDFEKLFCVIFFLGGGTGVVSGFYNDELLYFDTFRPKSKKAFTYEL